MGEDNALWSEDFNDENILNECYGNPISGEQALKEFGERAPVTQALIVHKEQCDSVRLRRILPRATAKDFFSSLVSIDGRFFFSGYLNGWSGLTLLEVATVEENNGPTKQGKFYFVAKGREITKVKKSKLSLSKTMKRFKKKKSKISPIEGEEQKPYFPDGVDSVLVKLYKPKWTDFGYSEENRGFVWYYAGAGKKEDRKLSYGKKSYLAADEYDNRVHNKSSKAIKAYHFGHRYAKANESRKDKLSYHTGVLIEWDHKEYCSIVELAWCYGIGGYTGRSNWVEDTFKKPYPELYEKIPAEMRCPFKTRKSEIRIIDIPVKNVEEFKAYLVEHSGKDKRFLDAKIKYEAKVRLVHNTKADIIKAMHNRISRDSKYAEPSVKVKESTFGWNCQTFAAGCFGYLTNETPKTFTLGLSVASRLPYFATDSETGQINEVKYVNKKKKGQKKKSKV